MGIVDTNGSFPEQKLESVQQHRSGIYGQDVGSSCKLVQRDCLDARSSQTNQRQLFRKAPMSKSSRRYGEPKTEHHLRLRDMERASRERERPRGDRSRGDRDRERCESSVMRT